jgi:enoyl-CoA hydratase
MTVHIERDGPVTTVIIDRPAARNAVDRATTAAPQVCLRHDRRAVYEGLGRPLTAALANELRHGLVSLAAGARDGAARFTEPMSEPATEPATEQPER